MAGLLGLIVGGCLLLRSALLVRSVVGGTVRLYTHHLTEEYVAKAHVFIASHRPLLQLDASLFKNLVHGLHSAIVSMHAADLVAALEKVPSELHDVLPMVKTAEQLLRDMELYERGGGGIALS